MGRVSRTAAIVWTLVSLGACSSIAGLDGITECTGGSCPFDSGQQPVDSSMGMDVSMQGDTGPVDDTGPGVDSAMTMDTGSVDSAMTVDSGHVDSQVVDSGTMSDIVEPDVKIDDAPFDAFGCGNLNTTTNCGGCLLTCAAAGATSHSNSAQCCTGSVCPGSTDGMGDSCQYACQNGHIDCNAGTPPNSDGCECTAPTGSACCGSACPTQHTTGLVGQSYYPTSPNFYDCVGTGTMNLQLAQDACAAYVTARGGTAAANCGTFGPIDSGPPDSVCAITANNCGVSCTGFMGDCICWTVSGTYVGQVLDPVAAFGTDNKCYTGSSSLTFN